MAIVKLAAGLAVGYVLGARAGREKYEQIAAAARQIGVLPRTVQADPQVADLQSDAGSVVTPTVDSSLEQPTAALTSDKPGRKRRPKAGATTATPSASDETPTRTTVDFGPDDLPLESAEADVVEQNMPVVDTSDEPARTPTPLESKPADVSEQRRSM